MRKSETNLRYVKNNVFYWQKHTQQPHGPLVSDDDGANSDADPSAIADDESDIDEDAADGDRNVAKVPNVVISLDGSLPSCEEDSISDDSSGQPSSTRVVELMEDDRDPLAADSFVDVRAAHETEDEAGDEGPSSSGVALFSGVSRFSRGHQDDDDDLTSCSSGEGRLVIE